MKLSKVQQGVVDHVRANGGRLRRWPGGYWTTEVYPIEEANRLGKEYWLPAWHCGTTTVMALEKKGVLVRAHAHNRDWLDDRVLA